LKRLDDGGVRAVVVATGIASVAVQLVLVREYLAQFRGNEIVIALIFFCWLVFGGIGTVAAKGLEARGLPASPDILALLSCLLAICPLARFSPFAACGTWSSSMGHRWGLPPPWASLRPPFSPTPCWWALFCPTA
jgi:hypothetical protein